MGHKLVEYPTSTQLQRLLSLSRRLRLLRVTEMQMPHEMCFFQNDPTPPLNTQSGFLKRNGRTMTREISRDARGRVGTRDGGGVDIRVSLSLDRVPQLATSWISPILCHFGWKGKVPDSPNVLYRTLFIFLSLSICCTNLTMMMMNMQVHEAVQGTIFHVALC